MRMAVVASTSHVVGSALFIGFALNCLLTGPISCTLSRPGLGSLSVPYWPAVLCPRPATLQHFPSHHARDMGCPPTAATTALSPPLPSRPSCLIWPCPCPMGTLAASLARTSRPTHSSTCHTPGPGPLHSPAHPGNTSVRSSRVPVIPTKRQQHKSHGSSGGSRWAYIGGISTSLVSPQPGPCTLAAPPSPCSCSGLTAPPPSSPITGPSRKFGDLDP